MEVSGQAKDGSLKCVRVDSVEVLERGSRHGFSDVCPDGKVYNIEVEGNHNYFANGVLVHNCHHYGSADAWRLAVQRFMDRNPNCQLVGCSATPHRSDKIAMYAHDVSGRPMLEEKHKSKLDNCLFQKLVFEYPIDRAIEEAYLVDLEPYTVKTKVDISDVKSVAGDLNKKELAKRVNCAARTKLAIEKWEEVASALPTIVFCVDVQHSIDTAQAWRDAGYTAEHVDGETEEFERRSIVYRFRKGITQVLTNCSVFKEGTDIPNIGCVMMLRPTKSQSAFIQMAGRGLRPLAGVIDGKETAEERMTAIAGSTKPHCVFIDVADIAGKLQLCTAPGILGLPCDLDLQGHSLMETKRLMAEFKEKKERVIGEHPTTFDELQGFLERFDVLGKSGAANADKWNLTKTGDYLHGEMRPGTEARITRDSDGIWHLAITGNGQSVKKAAPADTDHNKVFDIAQRHIDKLFPKATPKKKQTSDMLSYKQMYVLKKNGHSKEEVDGMTYGYAKKLIGEYAQVWRLRQQTAATAEIIPATPAPVPMDPFLANW